MPKRRLAPWLAWIVVIIVVAASGGTSAQGPRREEEEEEPKGKARPVVPMPIEPGKKDGPPMVPIPDDDVGTFREEEAKARHAAARDLFRALAIPYDRLTANFAGGTVYRIELFPHRELPDGPLEVRVLDATLRNSSERTFPTGSGFQFTPFELIVLEEVDKFLGRKLPMTTDQQMEYAARALAAALRWHHLEVSRNKRIGKGWDAVGRLLNERYIALQRERFKKLVEAKEYDRADALGLKLLVRYPDTPEVLRDVYHLQLVRLRAQLTTPSDAELARLREAVLAYERVPGLKDEALIQDARRRLRDRAVALIAEARDLDRKKMTAAALARVRQAELLDPDAPGMNEVRLALRGKVLYVGVTRLPERMSPATADTDPERWAVELMFEGLLAVVPDPEVVRYRPQLAESLPEVMPLGRSFALPRNVRWAKDHPAVVDARDVRGTLDLLRRPALRDRWPAEGLEVFEDIDRIVDPFRLRLAYRYGVLEPLGRATFKVLPAQELQAQGKQADDDEFARAPFGSGPYRYEGREREGPNREAAVFRANPFYGQRDGKFGLPWIREIRFVVPTLSSLPADVAGGQLHLFPDAPPAVVARIRSEPSLRDVLRVETARINRRIHILAINHRQPLLQNDRLRLGLSAAIHREAILKALYRTGGEAGHAALVGPFPVRCWATPPSALDAPLYKPGAGGLITEALGGGRKPRLRLAYEADDALNPLPPRRAEIAQLLKKHLEEGSADKSGQPQLEIELQELPPRVFREKVRLEFDYDLAFTTLDYRDDLYSLAGLLDPEACGRGGRNFLGYLGPGTNPGEADRRLRKLLEEALLYRDFSRQVKDRMWDIHALFNQRMPFIPLWQLDRAIVIHRDLDIYFDHSESPVAPDRIDPAIVFTGVEMWRWK